MLWIPPNYARQWATSLYEYSSGNFCFLQWLEGYVNSIIIKAYDPLKVLQQDYNNVGRGYKNGKDVSMRTRTRKDTKRLG